MRYRDLLLALFVGALALSLVFADPDPTGATLTPGPSSRGTNPQVENHTAVAGNVTILNIAQNRITDIWQGYYGNVTGQIVLENANNNVFYDWSDASITGEVYATRNVVASWSSVNCTNSTHWTNEETALNIPSAAVDGINETFSATNHPNFDVGTRTMAGCRATRPYNSTGLSSNFWNVLLNSNSTNTVYASILADDSDAYEGGTADFELLVPVDRSGGTALYWFYAELI